MVRTIPPSKRSFACYLFFLACVAFSNAGASTLSITTPSLMSGDAGVAYSQPLHATGGTAPYQWSLVGSGLPTGLSLSAAGTVSGTPTQAASYVFGVTVLDSSVPQQSLTANVTLTIGHTYYVDSVAGNDSNTGLSSAQPWKTLLKITESKFLPGDAILLKAGDVWNQGSQFNSASTAIQMLSSGTANNPIVLGSYGSGAVPLIDGSGTLTYLVVVKGAYVIVRNLALHNAIGYGVDVLASPHVTIQNCSFQNFGAAAINVGDNSPYILVDKNTATNSAGFTSSSGFLRFASISSDNPVISRNTVGDLNSHFGISTTDAMNVQIFGNTVTGNGHNITIEGQTRSVTGGKIYDNTAVGASTLEGDGENITLTGIAPYTVTADIYRNFVQGNANTAHGIAIFNAVNSRIYNNIVLNIPNGASFHVTSASKNNFLYNNSAYGALTYAFGFFNGSTGNTMRNNIAKNVTQEGIGVGTDSVTGFSEDYDILNQIGGRLTSTNIVAGAHTTTADPMFVAGTPAGPNDFKLQSASPAINAGAALGSPINMALDPASTAVPYHTLDQSQYGSGWERGAFVYNPAQPTTTTFTSSNDPSVYGAQVTFTATVKAVSGIPIGYIYFMDGSTQLARVALSGGTAAFTTSALASGTHTMNAHYGGNVAFATSTSANVIQTVN